MEKPFNVSDDRINTLFNILFRNAQDKNFKVFDNKTDDEILSVLQNGNVGFNNNNGNIFLCINIDGTLYKRSVSETEPTTPQAYIVETYRNGTDWYRIWSDGWIEQGGRISVNADGNSTVNLLKAFSDTNYTITTATHHTGTTVGGYNNAGGNWIQNISTTTFKIYEDEKKVTVLWYACGY